MLIITRKTEEKLIVADDIEITILEVGYNRVRFGIKAPSNVVVQYLNQTQPEASEVAEAPIPDAKEPSFAARAGGLSGS